MDHSFMDEFSENFYFYKPTKKTNEKINILFIIAVKSTNLKNIYIIHTRRAFLGRAKTFLYNFISNSCHFYSFSIVDIHPDG